MSAAVCHCVPSPHRHLPMSRPSPHLSPSHYHHPSLDAPILFARYPLPAPPAHSSSYLHAHPFSSHPLSPYSDALYDSTTVPFHRALPRLSFDPPLSPADDPRSFADVAQPSYDGVAAARSLLDDAALMQRQQARRARRFLFHIDRAHPSTLPALSTSLPSLGPLFPLSPSPPSPTASPFSQHPPPSTPSPMRSPPPSPLPAAALSALLSSSRRLSARELGLQSEWDGCPQCSICLTAFTVGCVILALPSCCHLFHEHCVSTWLEHKSRRCPLCRQEVTVGASDDVDDVHDGRFVPPHTDGGSSHDSDDDDDRGEALRAWRYA